MGNLRKAKEEAEELTGRQATLRWRARTLSFPSHSNRELVTLLPLFLLRIGDCDRRTMVWE